jgi:hypothetical protein
MSNPSFVANVADDALTVKNEHVYGYSTILFRDSGNVNRLVVGCGNSHSIMPNETYVMAVDGSGSGIPNDFVLCTFVGGKRVHLRMTGKGDIVIGDAPLATDATDGFFRVPSCAGAPTGAAADGSLVRDSVNHKLYLRSGGNWIALN